MMKSSDPQRITYQMMLLKGLSIPSMIKTGIDERDALFVHSLHDVLKKKETLQPRIDHFEIELQKGGDGKLHVTTVHPVDEKQAADLLEAIRYLDKEGEDFPEVRAMRHQEEDGKAYIIDEAATKVLKEHMPYRFSLSSYISEDEAFGLTFVETDLEAGDAAGGKREYIPRLKKEDRILLEQMNQAVMSGPGRMLVEFTLRPPQEDDTEFGVESIKIYRSGRQLPRGGVQKIVNYMDLSLEYDVHGTQIAPCYRIAGAELADLRRDLQSIIDSSRDRGIA